MKKISPATGTGMSKLILRPHAYASPDIQDMFWVLQRCQEEFVVERQEEEQVAVMSEERSVRDEAGTMGNKKGPTRNCQAGELPYHAAPSMIHRLVWSADFVLLHCLFRWTCGRYDISGYSRSDNDLWRRQGTRRCREISGCWQRTRRVRIAVRGISE